MTIQKKDKKIVDKNVIPCSIRGKILLNSRHIREDKLSDALANFSQMMQPKNDGYWSLLREE